MSDIETVFKAATYLIEFARMHGHPGTPETPDCSICCAIVAIETFISKYEKGKRIMASQKEAMNYPLKIYPNE